MKKKDMSGRCGRCRRKLQREGDPNPASWFLHHAQGHRQGFFCWKAAENDLWRSVVTPEQARAGAALAPVYCSFKCLVLAVDKPCSAPRCACKDKTI